MEENKKQPGLDQEAKTEKLEATPADQGQADVTEKFSATEIPADKPKVAKMETAEHRIEKSLAKQGVEHGEGDLHDALIPLYERYVLKFFLGNQPDPAALPPKRMPDDGTGIVVGCLNRIPSFRAVVPVQIDNKPLIVQKIEPYGKLGGQVQPLLCPRLVCCEVVG